MIYKVITYAPLTIACSYT